MNIINNGWDSTKRAETSCFHCGPSSQNENERWEKLVNEKKMRMEKSKENTPIYILCIYTHIHRQKNICTYRYAYAHIHVIY